MSAEPKADMEAAFAELEHAIWLAIKQGVMIEKTEFKTVVNGPDGEPWIVLLNIEHVGT